MLTGKDVRCDDQGFQIDAISSLYLEGHVWKPSVVLEPRVPARNTPVSHPASSEPTTRRHAFLTSLGPQLLVQRGKISVSLRPVQPPVSGRTSARVS